MASPRDLVTILYRPRETMQRVLSEQSGRWTVELVVLAFLCSSFRDSDVRMLPENLPDFSLGSTLALVALTLLLAAACWVLVLFGFAWVATVAGRRLEGHGTYADVRAALAWSLVPLIWSVLIRAPIAIYAYRLVPHTADKRAALMEVISRGGCTLAILVITLQIILYVWMAFIASSTVAEALHFSTGKGLTTLAIVFALPIVIGVAAALAMKT